MLQRIEIFDADSLKKIFALSFANLSDEELVELEEQTNPILANWETHEPPYTESHPLGIDKSYHLMVKENYVFALTTSLGISTETLEPIVESLFVTLTMTEDEGGDTSLTSELKRTVSDALSFTATNRQKERKTQKKPLAVFRPKVENQRTKFFLVGLAKAGKSSIYYQFFESWSIAQLEGITATIGRSQKKVDDEFTQEKFLINDLGGQLQFREKYLEDPTYFHGAAGLIFVVDCQDRDSIPTAENYFRRVLEQVDNDPTPHEPLIAIFIHKFDPLIRPELEENIFNHWMPMLNKVFRRYNPPFFLTSIYDNSVRESMARVFLQSMPQWLMTKVINDSMILQAAKTLYPMLNQLEPLIDDDVNYKLVESDLYESAQEFGVTAARRITKQWQEYLLQTELEQPEDGMDSSLELEVDPTGHFDVTLQCPIPRGQRRPELCAITHGLFAGLGKVFGYMHVEMVETEIRDNARQCHFSISD